MPTPKKYASSAQRQAAYRRRCEAGRQALPLNIPATAAIAPKPGPRRWEAMKRQALCLVEQVVSEMQTYHEQRSERWQDSERGEAFVEVLESVLDIADALNEIPSL